MRFAKYLFAIAGVWGVSVLTPLYFLIDVTGRHYPAPVTSPHFFYGFLSVAMAWQFAFFVIASNPARYRPMMIPGIVEKLGHVIGTVVLYTHGRISQLDMQGAVPDLVLAVLFVIAFVKTPSSDGGGPHFFEE